jgi:hypothetical protein
MTTDQFRFSLINILSIFPVADLFAIFGAILKTAMDD